MGHPEWNTPRKGYVLREVLNYRKEHGTVRKLTFEKKQNKEEWPSNATICHWLHFYDNLKAHNPSKSEIEIFDEACRRRGRTNRHGRPPKLDANAVNELVASDQLKSKQDEAQLLERLGVSRHTLRRVRKSRIPTVPCGGETKDHRTRSENDPAL